MSKFKCKKSILCLNWTNKNNFEKSKKEGVEVLSLETYQVVISLCDQSECGDPPCDAKNNSKQRRNQRGMRYARVEKVSRK